MDSKYLTSDDQINLINGVLRQAEADVFMHTLHSNVAKAVGNDEELKRQEEWLAIAQQKIDHIEKELPEAAKTVREVVEAETHAKSEAAVNAKAEDDARALGVIKAAIDQAVDNARAEEREDANKRITQLQEQHQAEESAAILGVEPAG